MNCTEFRQSLELPSAASRSAAAAHLQSCQDAECQQAWTEAEWLDLAIAAWKGSTPRVDCGDRVVAQWKADRSATVSARPASAVRPVGSATRGGGGPAPAGSSWIVLASALAVLAAVALIGSSGTQQRDVIADRDAGSAVDVHAPDVPATVGPVIAESTPPDQGMQDVSLAYIGVAQNATRFMTDVVMLTFGDSEEIEDPSIDQEWIDQWGEQLQPVGEGVDNAVDGILKSFPDSSSI